MSEATVLTERKKIANIKNAWLTVLCSIPVVGT